MLARPGEPMWRRSSNRAETGGANNPDAARAAFWKGVADGAIFGDVNAYDFGPKHPDAVPSSSADDKLTLPPAPDERSAPVGPARSRLARNRPRIAVCSGRGNAVDRDRPAGGARSLADDRFSQGRSRLVGDGPHGHETGIQLLSLDRHANMRAEVSRPSALDGCRSSAQQLPAANLLLVSLNFRRRSDLRNLSEPRIFREAA